MEGARIFCKRHKRQLAVESQFQSHFFPLLAPAQFVPTSISRTRHRLSPNSDATSAKHQSTKAPTHNLRLDMPPPRTPNNPRNPHAHARAHAHAPLQSHDPFSTHSTADQPTAKKPPLRIKLIMSSRTPRPHISTPPIPSAANTEQTNPPHTPRTPHQPPYSPITPVLSHSTLPPPDSSFTLPPSESPHTNTSWPSQSQSQQLRVSPTWIAQPTSLEPINLATNPDGIALRSATSILQLQRQQALRDIQALDRLKEYAKENPESFLADLKAGKLSKAASQGIEFDPDDDDDSSTGPIPNPQNIIRAPPVEWGKYHVLAEPLERMHDQQRQRPGSVEDDATGNEFLNPKHVVAGPYDPFGDRLENLNLLSNATPPSASRTAGQKRTGSGH